MKNQTKRMTGRTTMTTMITGMKKNQIMMRIGINSDPVTKSK